nr:AIPR family protein [Limnothrix sp. FACHB-406]
MSDLRSSENGLLAKYSRANLSSCAFHRSLEERNKILFIDGTDILSILKANFSKLSGKLPDIELRFYGQILQVENAYIGVVSGYELKRLYHEFGEAIFFENIRLFLGEGSKVSKSGGDSVNQVILKTVKQEPEVMLARNNGITFRSSKIIAGDTTILNLSEASIINGCQTTMCFVKGLIDDESLEKDNISLYDKPPFVLVKVVETNNSWDIAKSANFQNEVVQIDLELARYFRPQIVQRASVNLGIFAEQASLENQKDTPYSIIKTMTKVTVDYDSTRSTFIGLFSRVLNNTIAGDYTALRTDLLEEFLSNDDTGQKIFGLIFDMNSKFLSDYSKISELKSRKSQEKDKNQESVADTLWSRLEKPNYQAFMNILVACVINRRNIYAQSRQIAFHEMESFLEGVINFNDKQRTKYYLECWKAITTVAIENKVAREINLKQLFAKFRDLGTGVGFSNLYETITSTYLLELEL